MIPRTTTRRLTRIDVKPLISNLVGAVAVAIISGLIINAMNSTAALTAEYWRQYVVGASAQHDSLAACKENK